MKKALVIIISLVLLVSCASRGNVSLDAITIGVAWRKDASTRSAVQIMEALKETGAKVVMLDKVITTDYPYERDGSVSDDALDWTMSLNEEAVGLLREYGWTHSNAESVVGDVDLIVFSGGEDISPYLYGVEPDWDLLEGCNATRDVSDYLLMDYALSHGIPVLGVCRGMQMLLVHEGGRLVQDIGALYEENGLEYTFIHRMEERDGRNYVPHPIQVTERKSVLGKILGKGITEGVPSWHHQVMADEEAEGIRVTAYSTEEDIRVVEGIEIEGKAAYGIQFHPEYSVYAESPEGFMTKEDALDLFSGLFSALLSWKP